MTFKLLSRWTHIGLLFFVTASFAQQAPIDVTEQTIKLGPMQEQELQFGFAAGDKILFQFKEINDKELKEIEVIEYPNTPKFSDYKTTQIDTKTIQVVKQGVYLFKFKNGAILGRICKIKIQRVPASEATISFNTAVSWEDKQETTYNTYTKEVLAGYDTTYTRKTQKVVVKSEQREELVFDKPQRVHSSANTNGNKASLSFTLPKNIITPYKTTKVVSWAYWVGVGNEANEAWKQNSKIIVSIAKGAAAYFTTPLGALAAGVVTDLAIPKMGEDVYYAVADKTNRDLFMAGQPNRVIDQGKGVAGFRKFSDPALCQGAYYVLLSNDNLVQGVDASVKVIAIVETTTYEDKVITETNLTPRYEKKTFSEPVIKTVRMPVTGK